MFSVRASLTFFILFWVLTTTAYGVSLDSSIENTNIATYRQEQRLTDSNRLRLQGLAYDERIAELTATVIIDNLITYSQEKSEFDCELKLYRGYLEYGTDKHLFVAGRQRIPFGVGRLWNPIDIFNPIDSASIEPDEREGVDAFRYEYAVSDLSNVDITIAEKKGAGRIKGFLGSTDVALVALIDNDQDKIILGWEIEGELGESGIDLRSEGGSFYDQDKKEYHTEFIVGGEYGFANSLTLLMEYYYNDDGDGDHLGITLSYQPSPLLFINMLVMINLDDHSTLLAPTFTYSLSDEMTLATGIFLYNGDSGETFGDSENLAFIKWFIHF